MNAVLSARGLAKTFTLHGRGGVQLPVFAGVDLQLRAGECLALTGRSGSGKSSLLRCLYGNYAATGGEVGLLHQGQWLTLSQAQPLRQLGVAVEEARARAGEWLARLNLGERLWQLPPATFSGGEQQRVNIAHGLIAGHPILLLDEPTASLDAANRAVVVDLIREACGRGAAVIGIFHDEEVRDAVASRRLDVESFRT